MATNGDHPWREEGLGGPGEREQLRRRLVGSPEKRGRRRWTAMESRSEAERTGDLARGARGWPAAGAGPALEEDGRAAAGCWPVRGGAARSPAGSGADAEAWARSPAGAGLTRRRGRGRRRGRE